MNDLYPEFQATADVEKKFIASLKNFPEAMDLVLALFSKSYEALPKENRDEVVRNYFGELRDVLHEIEIDLGFI